MLRFLSLAFALALIVGPFVGVNDVRMVGIVVTWAIFAVGSEIVAKIEAASAELRGLTNRRVMELAPEDAARRVA